MRLHFLTLAALLTCAAPMRAQQSPARPGPRIDPLTASISGRVTAADSGAPVRRAEVRVMSDGSVSRLATTDTDGRYVLRDLPAGQYRLSVSRSGYVTLSFGQRRPAEAITPIDVAEGQRVTANVALPRGGAIAGRILDEAGEPVADVRVQAMRARMANGGRRVEPIGVIDTTDDRGAFRLYGLEPGDYYVSAMVRSPTPEDARMTAFTGPMRGDIKSSVPVFFPGATSLEQAQPVSLTLGGEARADIFLSPLRTATISGVVLDSTGAPAVDATLDLRSQFLAFGFSAAFDGPPPMAVSAHVEPDGSFRLPNVPPGSYTLTARAQNQRARGALEALIVQAGQSGRSEDRLKAMQQVELGVANSGETATMPLVVGNADITGVTVTTLPGATLNVTYVADSGSSPLPPPGSIRVEPIGAQQQVMSMNLSSTSVPQLRFGGLSGNIRLRVTVPDEWALKSITVNGTDVTDVPIAIRSGSVDARVTLTDRVTEVSGALPQGVIRDAYVVVFAADAAKLGYPSRFIRSARTDAQGTFRIKGLPGNERYLAAAVEFLEAGEEQDPQFLDRMRGQATTFSLGEGERKTIDVKPVQR